MIFFGAIVLALGIAGVIYGAFLNNSAEAQLESVLESGMKNPGTALIIIGSVAAAAGLALIVVGIIKRVTNKDAEQQKSRDALFVRRLTESAIMVALATILSFIKLVDLPYGGSVTIASLLPILVIAYRHGVLWGLFTGVTHGAIQFVLGSSVLSYVTGWKSVVAVILLDYIIAFAAIGLGGITRKLSDQRAAIVSGAVIAGAARYICHVISGATVWAGLSIPDAAAMKYSLIYNATYMIPETIVLILVGIYLFSTLDFSGKRLKAYKKDELGENYYSRLLITASAVIPALIFIVASVFAHLQNAETGTFDITGMSEVNWLAVGAVAIESAFVVIVTNILLKKKKNENK